MSLANERVAYFNGEIMPESRVLIPFRDRGYKFGDAAFDVARTFGGKAFKLREHVARLYRSLKYLRIDPGLTPEEMFRISEEVLERNRHLLDRDDDYWLAQRISRGVDVVGGELWESGGPSVIVECTPLPLKPRARLFRDGIDIALPSLRRVPPDSLSPNVKSHNYLNLVLGDLEVRSQNPDAWAILLDTRGYLCEGIGSNIFTVKEGTIYTPKSQYVLAGVTRETVLELAAECGIPAVEADLSPYDGCTADEAFITSTSFCVCPVRSINGVTLGDGTVPGPVTKALTDAFIALVDHDFVAQYTRQLS